MKIAFVAIGLLLAGALLPLWMIILAALAIAVGAMFLVGRSRVNV